MSGVGKGVASSSIGKLLQSQGYSVSAIKIDPYVNVDAGTMNPTEHGEVFVLNDGTECDQDMGNYERFLDRDFDRRNYMTTGSIYLSIIKKERALHYKGKNVEVVPHVPLEVMLQIKKAASKDKADIVITEVGGTVGEYQNLLFLEAIRMLRQEKPKEVLVVLVSYLPQQGAKGELKTKPTQHAVRDLHYAGLQPDIILARAKTPLDKKRKQKIAFNCSMREKDVISAPDVESIYEIPINFEKENLSTVILEKLGLKGKKKKKDFDEWRKMVKSIKRTSKPVKIGIVGKYFQTGDYVLSDSYISVIEAIHHATFALKRKPIIDWLDAAEFEPRNKQYRTNLKKLSSYNGVIVPGGFGARGVEGKIRVIKYVRENKIPFLGICYGMQLALIEFARNILKLKRANSVEISPRTPHPVINLMPEQKKMMEEGQYGATMRLGAYPAQLVKGTLAYRAYGLDKVFERHRHRYEVNPKYVAKFEKRGMIFSAVSPDKKLMEIAELPQKKHPFFLGTQFHPEFTSRPLNPNPLFLEFLKSAISAKS